MLGELAQNANRHNCDIEPPFECFSVVTYDTEGSASDEDTSHDDVEIGSFRVRLHRLLRSYRLIQVAGVLCTVVARREIRADQYVLPLTGYTVPAKGRPLAWDLFGHFAQAARAKALLLVEATGHAHLKDDPGIEPD